MEALAREAIANDPYSAFAYATLGFGTQSNSEAKAALERALELGPSSADILNLAADRMAVLGQPELGAELCDRSFRLNPISPTWYYLDCIAGYFFTGRYSDMVEASDHVRAERELNPFNLVFRAASQAELGQAAQAEETVAELRRRFPAASIEFYLQNDMIFERKQDEERLLASTRKAGVRICATDEELKPFASPRRLPECVAAPAG